MVKVVIHKQSEAEEEWQKEEREMKLFYEALNQINRRWQVTSGEVSKVAKAGSYITNYLDSSRTAILVCKKRKWLCFMIPDEKPLMSIDGGLFWHSVNKIMIEVSIYDASIFSIAKEELKKLAGEIGIGELRFYTRYD